MVSNHPNDIETKNWALSGGLVISLRLAPLFNALAGNADLAIIRSSGKSLIKTFLPLSTLLFRLSIYVQFVSPFNLAPL